MNPRGLEFLGQYSRGLVALVPPFWDPPLDLGLGGIDPNDGYLGFTQPCITHSRIVPLGREVGAQQF